MTGGPRSASDGKVKSQRPHDVPVERSQRGEDGVQEVVVA